MNIGLWKPEEKQRKRRKKRIYLSDDIEKASAFNLYSASFPHIAEQCRFDESVP